MENRVTILGRFMFSVSEYSTNISISFFIIYCEILYLIRLFKLLYNYLLKQLYSSTVFYYKNANPQVAPVKETHKYWCAKKRNSSYVPCNIESSQLSKFRETCTSRFDFDQTLSTLRTPHGLYTPSEPQFISPNCFTTAINAGRTAKNRSRSRVAKTRESG